jgi:4-hydroxy-tetrahydrodipicolinate synthase
MPTLERARRFDDLPYDYYAALPPWYLPMTPDEVIGYFQELADRLSRPLIIYNAPWVCNQLTWEHLQRLAAHPRIAGCKDVTPLLGRSLDWTRPEREALGFSYLHGSDLIGLSAALGADGFVSALSDVVPALAVALWSAARAQDAARVHKLQVQYCLLGRVQTFGTSLACLDAAGRHLGLFRSMLPPPLLPLGEVAARRVAEVFDEVGHLPEAAPRVAVAANA